MAGDSAGKESGGRLVVEADGILTKDRDGDGTGGGEVKVVEAGDFVVVAAADGAGTECGEVYDSVTALVVVPATTLLTSSTCSLLPTSSVAPCNIVLEYVCVSGPTSSGRDFCC